MTAFGSVNPIILSALPLGLALLYKTRKGIMTDDDSNYDDMNEVSDDDRALLKTIHQAGIPASEVTTRIKGAVQARSARATAPAKPAATQQDMEKLADESEQRTRARELHKGVRSVVRDVADNQGLPQGKPRRGLVEDVMQIVGKREDIAEMDEEMFDTVVRETAAKVVEDSGKQLVADAASMPSGNGKPPTDAKAEKEIPVQTPKSDAKAVGQTSAGESPPRSDVKSNAPAAGRHVTDENLEQSYGRDDVIWPSNDATVEEERSQAAAGFLQKADRSG